VAQLFSLGGYTRINDMKIQKRSVLRILAGFVFRSTLLHFVTYLVAGIAVFHFTRRFDESLPDIQDLHGNHVMHWAMPAQLIRGLLLGFVLFPLRRALLDMGRWGGLVIACILFMVSASMV
jgi:hypothetical protein